MGRTALILGISGQIGPYLAKLLHSKGYKIIGVSRRTSDGIYDFDDVIDHKLITMVEADLLDENSIYQVMNEYKPDEVYNLAAQSHVGSSFNQPSYTADVTGFGVLRLLEVIRLHFPQTKFFQASSSEMFGDVENPEIGKGEDTPFRPMSPYAVSKIFAHNLVQVYRRAYGLFCCSAILFNVESPRRGSRFVTKKITDWFGRYANLSLDILELGYMDAQRDWFSAIDAVEGIYKIMQYEKPEDFVLCSGKSHSVRDIIKCCANVLEYDIVWVGEGKNESVNIDNLSFDSIFIDPKLYRPSEVPLLKGDYSKAKKLLDWAPTMDFSELIEWMLESDVKKYANTKN